MTHKLLLMAGLLVFLERGAALAQPTPTGEPPQPPAGSLKATTLPRELQLIVAAHRLDLKSVRALVAAGANVNGRLELKWLPTLRAIGETELGGIPAIQWIPLHAVAAHALSADAPPAATGTAGVLCEVLPSRDALAPRGASRYDAAMSRSPPVLYCCC